MESYNNYVKIDTDALLHNYRAVAKKAGVPMAFAGWSRADFPEIRAQMSRICDFSFESTKDLAKFLFD